MEASEKVIGVSGEVTVAGVANVVTITFSPSTMLDPSEGAIKVICPPNFDSLFDPIYAHDDAEFACSSDQLYGTKTTAESDK